MYNGLCYIYRIHGEIKQLLLWASAPQKIVLSQRVILVLILCLKSIRLIMFCRKGLFQYHVTIISLIHLATLCVATSFLCLWFMEEGPEGLHCTLRLIVDIINECIFVLADGAFDYAPKHFYQMYSMHSRVSAFSIPVVTCF